MAKKRIPVAKRELKRLVTSAVGGNFFKTAAELITNSDSALKRLASVPHAAGLVDRILGLKSGDRIDTSSLKGDIPRLSPRRICLEVTTKRGRSVQVLDYGPGMSEAELMEKFGEYASAKAKGEKTRSLFGRGALDVLLYHTNHEILSVSGGVLSRARINWDQSGAEFDADTLGPTTKSLLKKHGLPDDMGDHGTVVRFTVQSGTSIPQESDILGRVSSFYMLRLIASDPNTQLVIKRNRASDTYADEACYDFPVGTVLGRFSDVLRLKDGHALRVDILVARSEEDLDYDPTDVTRKDGGLLFVDDNDAVLDITRLPEYEKSPYLKQIFGVVRIKGIREVLEARLEAEEPDDVLTVSRDGFSTKHEITKALFGLVTKHVAPVYEKEEARHKKGHSQRSKELDRRLRGALQALNKFTSDQDGGGTPPTPECSDPVYFSVKSAQLHTGEPRTVHLYVNQARMKNGQSILIGTDNVHVTVNPEECRAKHKRRAKRHHIAVKIQCGVKDQKATITALTQDRDGNERTAELQVIGVSDPTPPTPPETIEFSRRSFGGSPNKPSTASLLVNLAAFHGMPSILFYMKQKTGFMKLGDEGDDELKVKVDQAHLTEDSSIARVPVQFTGTAWGQHAELWAKVKTKDGEYAFAKCKIRLERQPGNERFKDTRYEPLESKRAADVALSVIYVNSDYLYHREIFGNTQEEFDERLETNIIAQTRAAQLMVEAVVYDTASRCYIDGKLHLGQDPITGLRSYIEEHRMKLEPVVSRSLAPGLADAAKPSAGLCRSPSGD